MQNDGGRRSDSFRRGAGFSDVALSDDNARHGAGIIRRSRG